MAAIESHNTGDDSSTAIYGAEWRAQAFTASQSYNIGSVKLLLYRDGTPGTVTASIRAVDGDSKPTGADLASGTYDGDTLATDTAGEWVEFTFASSTALTNATVYSIVVKATTASGVTLVRWRVDTSSGYAGGGLAASSNSGSSWGAVSGSIDGMFETYEATVSYEELEGEIVGAGSTEGTLEVGYFLTGTISAAGSITGTLGILVSLAGSVTGAGSITGGILTIGGTPVPRSLTKRLIVFGTDGIWYQDLEGD